MADKFVYTFRAVRDPDFCDDESDEVLEISGITEEPVRVGCESGDPLWRIASESGATFYRTAQFLEVEVTWKKTESPKEPTPEPPKKDPFLVMLDQLLTGPPLPSSPTASPGSPSQTNSGSSGRPCSLCGRVHAGSW